ncbi:hypothetical protein, partial [Flavobacterium franklandianum]|uniref:hypothetical protein n=1 Tax=Flavobacterium franklandianum TaxID=2594430 RepID=UPI00163DE269
QALTGLWLGIEGLIFLEGRFSILYIVGSNSKHKYKSLFENKYPSPDSSENHYGTVPKLRNGTYDGNG